MSSSMLRITGMATGMDTDNTIKQMMKPYTMKLDKMNQDKQIVMWKQDMYREIVGDINTLKSTYLDRLKPDSCILLKKSYSGFDVSTASNSVSATATAGATSGQYTVSNVITAKKASKTGEYSNIQGDNAAGLNITSNSNDILSVTVNGAAYNVTIPAAAYADTDALKTAINTSLQNAVKVSDSSAADLSGKLEVSALGTKLQFKAKSSDVISMSSGTSNSALTNLGFMSTSININPTGNDKISNLIKGAVAFKITSNSGDPVSFSYDFNGADKDKTINDILNDISSKAGVNASYSELGKKFTLSSAATGENATITTMTTSGTFLSTLFGAGVDNTTFKGSNGSATITDPNGNSSTVVQAKNTFEVDGMTYTLLKDDLGASTLNVADNPQKVVDKIKGFVTKYNELIDKVTKKLEEKTQKEYLPLTDDQKKDMKAEDIANWESKAKEGLLRNDNLLGSLANSLRNTLYQAVGGVTLSDTMGLGTSDDTTERGKLVFDEDKFKTAIQNNGSQIMKLFTQTSSTFPNYSKVLDSTSRQTRTAEEGIFQRISDVLEDYTTTVYSDSNGKKGYLIEKAGLKGQASEINNLLYKDLVRRDKEISAMSRKISDKENAYYLQFSKLEQAMNNMNSQSSWLSQQLGGGK